MNSKYWIIGFLLIVVSVLAGTAYKTISVDPFFHYHLPDTDKYFYVLNNERSQNDGIIRFFDYTGLITGTSMTENFRASEADDLWGGKFIKVPFSGGSHKEINEHIKTAASHNSDLKIVIRGLDLDLIFTDKDYLREELGEFPVYLYDKNPFNDVKYIFNRDVFFSRVYKMEKEKDTAEFKSGITSFDDCYNWMRKYKFGKNTLFPEGITILDPKPDDRISEEIVRMIRENIKVNVTDIADAYPDITFYCFFPPYSAVYWLDRRNEGALERRFRGEEIMIEEILKHQNIKLFSFTNLFDITTDLNNYKDSRHYGEWINSLLLRYMHDEKNLLTEENYKQYLSTVEDFYVNYDYALLMKGEDYPNDYYAAALLNHEVTGTDPYHIDLNDSAGFELSNAVIQEDLYQGNPGVVCTGRLQRSGKDQINDYIRDNDYVGIKIPIEDVSPYSYLVFYGRKTKNQGEPLMLLYDEKGQAVKSFNKKSSDINTKWQQYLIDIRGIKGPVTLVLNGGAPTRKGKANSRFIFSDITLY